MSDSDSSTVGYVSRRALKRMGFNRWLLLSALHLEDSGKCPGIVLKVCSIFDIEFRVVKGMKIFYCCSDPADFESVLNDIERG